MVLVSDETVEVDSDDARAWWRALMTNVVDLIVDSHRLLRAGSVARARSLTILALEELGKAERVYNAAERPWSTGLSTVPIPEQLLDWRRHPEKLDQGLFYSDYLPAFWGDWMSIPIREPIDGGFAAWHDERRQDTQARARDLNLKKQSGFYVDRSADGALATPATDPVTHEEVSDLHKRVAGAAEMLLITDHSRMKQETPDRYDSTHMLQTALLIYSHPEDFESAR